LTAAYVLAKQGRYRITVSKPMTSWRNCPHGAVQGFRFDIGGHRFFTKVQPVEDLWHEILGPELISVPRLSRIHYNGRFFDYLSSPPMRYGSWSISALRIVLSYVKWHYRPYPIETTSSSGSRTASASACTRSFSRPTRRRSGRSVHRDQGEWAAQRIHGLSLAEPCSMRPLHKR